MMKLPILLLSAVALLSAGCHPTVTPVGPEPSEWAALVYTTNTSGLRFQESRVPIGEPVEDAFNVTLTGESFQTVDGFGFAITQASCYNLLQMPADGRNRFLKEIFSREEGLGSSLIRVCIGGSDFSLDEFTWCDRPGIGNFAVHPLDEQYLFPILKEIFAINPAVRIIASPWSCPRWMKVDAQGRPFDSWTDGRLNPAFYGDYARYFVQWVQEMERRGFPIYAVTLQNEPLNPGNSMSLYMPWQDQRDFLKVVGPAFAEAGLKTKILLFDHNYNFDGIASQNDYPLRIFEDAEAAPFAAGSAWHNYGGSVTTLDRVHGRFPDKEIYFTEASIGTWNYQYEKCVIDDFRDIFLGTLSRYGKGVTLWNLMLDDQRRPYRPGGCSTCFGAVSISSSS
ncbi:MAG: glucosylceramidase, partial [Bacteroidales bacterium]|nr:glucosylceramidase [Bacteroidales bacterium]